MRKKFLNDYELSVRQSFAKKNKMTAEKERDVRSFALTIIIKGQIYLHYMAL